MQWVGRSDRACLCVKSEMLSVCWVATVVVSSLEVFPRNSTKLGPLRQQTKRTGNNLLLIAFRLTDLRRAISWKTGLDKRS